MPRVAISGIPSGFHLNESGHSDLFRIPGGIPPGEKGEVMRSKKRWLAIALTGLLIPQAGIPVFAQEPTPRDGHG